MSNIIDIEDRRKRKIVEAKCASCGHEWTASIPLNLHGNLECPSCGKMEGTTTGAADE